MNTRAENSAKLPLTAAQKADAAYTKAIANLAGLLHIETPDGRDGDLIFDAIRFYARPLKEAADEFRSIVSESEQSKDSPSLWDLGRVHISTEAERQYREAGAPVGPGTWHEGFKRGFTYALSLRDSAEQAEDDPRDHAIQLLRENMQGLINTLKYSERTNQVDAMRKCEDALRATVEFGK